MDFKEIYKHTETKKIVDKVKKVYKHFTEPQEKKGKPKGKKYGETDHQEAFPALDADN